MDREECYNMIRGCIIASGLDNPTKRELCEFLQELESHEDYIEEDEDED